MKKKIIISILLVALAVFALASCGDNTPEYTVTFDTNGGTMVQSVTVAEGDRVPTPAAPYKEGYSFVGWYHNGVLFNTEVETAALLFPRRPLITAQRRLAPRLNRKRPVMYLPAGSLARSLTTLPLLFMRILPLRQSGTRKFTQ